MMRAGLLSQMMVIASQGAAPPLGGDPESIFSSFTGSEFEDGAPYALGTRFTVDVAGNVTHARWYAATTESGNHEIRLWNNGATIAIASNVGRSGPGWVTYEFPSPVAVTTGQTYTIAVSTGGDAGIAYVAQSGLHNSEIESGNINVPIGGGVFNTQRTLEPVSSIGNNGYFRDIIFVPGS